MDSFFYIKTYQRLELAASGIIMCPN